MSRQGSLVKNTLIFSIGTILPKLGVFITLPVLTGCLTKSEYGSFDLIFAIFPVILPILTLDIHMAAFRFLIDARKNLTEAKRIVSNTLVFSTVMSVIFLIPFSFFIPGEPSMRLLTCIYMFMSLIAGTVGLFTRGIGSNLDFSLSAVISSSFNVLFIVLLIWYFNTGLTGAVISVIIASASSLIFLACRLRLFRYIDLSLISMKQIKQMVSYSWPEIPNTLCWWVIRASDRFLLVSFIGLAANASYAVAHRIPGLLNTAQGTFFMAWSENASLAMKDKDKGEYYSYMFRTVQDLMAGLMGLIIASTPLLFAILIKGDYSDAYSQMPILFIATFFNVTNTFLAGIYMACKKPKEALITTAKAAVCNFAVNIALIKFIGVYAASISTLVSYGLIVALRMRDAQKFADMKFDIKHLSVLVAFMSLMAALCCVRNIYLDIANIIMGIAFFTVLNKNVIITSWKKLSAGLGKIFAK